MTTPINGTTTQCPFNHNNINLCCRPAKWTDILIFYLGNYFAHAATTKSLPGESTIGSTITVFTALLFPTSGVVRGTRAIYSRAIFANTDLQTAARAGALCTVVKDPSNAVRSVVQLLSKKIHGQYHPPSGYSLVIVPRKAEFQNDNPVLRSNNIIKAQWQKFVGLFSPQRHVMTNIACNYNVVKIAVALGQTLFAISTLYRTKGDQITLYGYSAFGLTVVPYAFMSVVNLLGNLICPEYPALYLVEPPAISNSDEEGEDEDIKIQGSVGKLTNKSYAEIPQHRRQNLLEANGTQLDNLRQDRLGEDEILHQSNASATERRDNSAIRQFKRYGKPYAIILAASAIPLAIIGGISHFRPGSSSSHAQRVWIMTWILFGMVMGPSMELLTHLVEDPRFLNNGPVLWSHQGGWQRLKQFRTVLIVVSCIFFYGAPAIGGFIVVGQMIDSYGTCFRLNR